MEPLGNTWIDYQISRGPFRGGVNNSKVGLRFTVRARPELEDLMQRLSGDNRAPIDAFGGDLWVPMEGRFPEALEAYVMDDPLTGSGYTLSQIGGTLLRENRDRAAQRLGEDPSAASNPTVNLSFLKLVGISNPEGVTFGLIGPYSFDYINQLRRALPLVTKQFLQEYIVPVDIRLSIVNRD